MRLSSFHPAQLPGLSSLTTLSPCRSHRSFAFAWLACSFLHTSGSILAHCLKGLSSARSLLPSFVCSLLLATESPQAYTPACGGKTATSTLPHLEKANCIERRRHRHPSPAWWFSRGLFRFASFSLATLDECTFHWWHGGRLLLTPQPPPPPPPWQRHRRARADGRGRRRQRQSLYRLSSSHASRQAGRKLNCRLTTRCAINDDSDVGSARARSGQRNERE